MSNLYKEEIISARTATTDCEKTREPYHLSQMPGTLHLMLSPSIAVLLFSALDMSPNHKEAAAVLPTPNVLWDGKGSCQCSDIFLRTSTFLEAVSALPHFMRLQPNVLILLSLELTLTG